MARMDTVNKQNEEFVEINGERIYAAYGRLDLSKFNLHMVDRIEGFDRLQNISELIIGGWGVCTKMPPIGHLAGLRRLVQKAGITVAFDARAYGGAAYKPLTSPSKPASANYHMSRAGVKRDDLV